MNEAETLKLYAQQCDPIIGPPEWDDEETELPWTLNGTDTGQYAEMVEGDESRQMTNHEALCLRREWCGKWLYQRRGKVDICPMYPQEGYLMTLEGRRTQEYDSYDAALIAAVCAIGKDTP